MSNDLPKGKPILCLDFDGVIHSYTSGWKGARCIPDAPVPGALLWIMEVIRSGKYEVNIYSSRSRYWFGRWAMKKWLIQQLFLISADWDKTPEWVKKWTTESNVMEPWPNEVERMSKMIVSEIKFPVKKPAAYLQIDDRCLTFNGKFPTIEEIDNFKPWYKKNFPDGKLSQDDEGELRIAISEKDGRVTVSFGKEIRWLGFDKKSAIDFGNAVISRAKALSVIALIPFLFGCCAGTPCRLKYLEGRLDVLRELRREEEKSGYLRGYSDGRNEMIEIYSETEGQPWKEKREKTGMEEAAERASHQADCETRHELRKCCGIIVEGCERRNP